MTQTTLEKLEWLYDLAKLLPIETLPALQKHVDVLGASICRTGIRPRCPNPMFIRWGKKRCSIYLWMDLMNLSGFSG